MSSTNRSLVLGAYSRLPVQHLEPFVRSLRATGFRGAFCIVAGRCDQEERAQLDELADSVVDVDSEYGTELPVARTLLTYLRRTRGLRRTYAPAFQAVARATSERSAFRRWSSLEYHLEGLQTLRYLHYHRYICARKPLPDVVMITDLRDVVFQCDPFSDPVRGLELYLEDAAVRIGEDDFNTRWIRDLFGAAELHGLRGRPVSCSGTVVGTRETMLAYLAEMTAQIVWRRRPMGPRDQAVHNMLLHGGRLFSAKVIRNGYGRVLTMGKMPTYRTSPEGTILNVDGSIPAVLHQWDRHGDLVAQLEGRDVPFALANSS